MLSAGRAGAEGRHVAHGSSVAAFSLAACGIGHGVALVENDPQLVEIGPQPIDDLPDAGNLLAAVDERSVA